MEEPDALIRIVVDVDAVATRVICAPPVPAPDAECGLDHVLAVHSLCDVCQLQFDSCPEGVVAIDGDAV
jgi:hypothetical protein